MKRIVSGLMIVVWLATIVGGCQTQSPSGSDQSKGGNRPELTEAPPDIEATIAEFDLPLANFKVKEFSSDPEQGKVWMRVRLAWGSDEVTYNVITFSAHMTDSVWDGASVLLADENDSLLWEYVLGWDFSDTTWMTITEQTSLDTLSIQKFLPTDSTATEVYTFNGTQLNITVPLYFWESPASLRLTAEDQALLQQTDADFQTFYGTGNSLSDNRYGIVLTQMLADEGFRSWFASYLSSPLLKAVPNPTALASSDDIKDLICLIAEVCSWKCRFTGWCNPLCVPCIGVGAACFIAAVVKLIQNWN